LPARTSQNIFVDRELITAQFRIVPCEKRRQLRAQSSAHSAAATHFETARATTDRARGMLTDAGSTADPADLAAAVTALDEARALAAKLDQAAGQKAASAVALLDKAASAP